MVAIGDPVTIDVFASPVLGDGMAVLLCLPPVLLAAYVQADSWRQRVEFQCGLRSGVTDPVCHRLNAGSHDGFDVEHRGVIPVAAVV